MMRKLRVLLFVVLSFFLVTSWTTSVFAEAKAAETLHDVRGAMKINYFEGDLDIE